MVKKRAKSGLLILYIMLITGFLNTLHMFGIITQSNDLFSAMLTTTCIYLLCGYILDSHEHYLLSVAFGVIALLILCGCVFYSHTLLDVLVFIFCITVSIQRLTSTCDSVRNGNNPFV